MKNSNYFSSYPVPADDREALRTSDAQKTVSTSTAVRYKAADRARIESDTALFLTRGGVVEALGNTPLKHRKTARENDLDCKRERAIALKRNTTKTTPRSR